MLLQEQRHKMRNQDRDSVSRLSKGDIDFLKESSNFKYNNQRQHRSAGVTNRKMMRKKL